ncbi:protein of unknown function [Rhodovastum atsumiense]|nr:protein of unknown function [Rhodovastum atsumiense]
MENIIMTRVTTRPCARRISRYIAMTALAKISWSRALSDTVAAMVTSMPPSRRVAVSPRRCRTGGPSRLMVAGCSWRAAAHAKAAAQRRGMCNFERNVIFFRRHGVAEAAWSRGAVRVFMPMPCHSHSTQISPMSAFFAEPSAVGPVSFYRKFTLSQLLLAPGLADGPFGLCNLRLKISVYCSPAWILGIYVDNTQTRGSLRAEGGGQWSIQLQMT